MPAKKAPTVRRIAEMSGVHFTTVSKILRGKSRAAKTTRERVLKVADRLGYRPNPMASAWMAQRRAANPARTEANLGFVFAELQNPYNRELSRVLHASAEKHGYAADDFTLADYTSVEAIARVLNARGIKGVVWSGMVHRKALPSGFADCAMCSFGGEVMGVSTVRTRAFEGMRIVLTRFREMGLGHPVLVLSQRPTDWNLIRYEAAFRLAHQRREFKGAPRVIISTGSIQELERKIAAFRDADSVITNTGRTFARLPTANLDARPGPHMGIDQRRDVMAQIAIDQVAGALVSPVGHKNRPLADLAISPHWVEAV